MKSSGNKKTKQSVKKIDTASTILHAREEELAVINKVQKGLAAKLDIKAIYDLVGEEIRKIFDSQVVTIVSFDHKKKTEHFNYVIEKDKRFYHKPRPIDKLRKELIKKGRTILINNNTKEVQKRYGLKTLPGTKPPKSLVFVPLTSGKKVNGYISLQNIDRKDAFSKSDVQLLSTLAHSLSAALQSATLFDETNQRNAELAIINSVGEAMSRKLDVKTVTKIVGDKVRDIFKAEATEILLLDLKSNMIEVPYSFFKTYQKVEPFALGEGMTSKIISSRKYFVANTFHEQELFGAIVDEGMGEADETESYMGVPIIVGSKVLGVVSVQSYKENAFNQNNVNLLSTLSTNMGIVIENARLFDNTVKLLTETQQRNAELAVINKVQEGLVAKMDIQAIYDLVGEEIREIFDAQVVSIGSYDYENQLCHFKYDIEKGKRFYEEPRKFTHIDNYLTENQKIILINERMVQGLKSLGEKPKPVPGTEMPKSAVWVPLIVGKIVRGHVSLQNIDKENAFSDSDVRLLTTLANSMSIALESARLFEETNRLLEETKQRNAELGVINSVQEGLVAKMDMQAIYDLVGNKIQEIFNAQSVDIASFNYKDQTEQYNFSFEKGKRFYPKPRSIDKLRKHLIEDSETILINNNVEKAIKKFGLRAVPGTEMPKSLLFVPLSVGKKVNGYISLQNIDEENAFSDSDVRLLKTLANSMSVALENARLFDETNRLLEATKQQAAELKIINTVGEGLAQKLDYQAIIDLVGEKVREIFDAKVVTISTYNKENNTIHHLYVFEDNKRFYFDKSTEIDPDRKEIIETKKPLVFGTKEEIIEHSGGGVIAGEMPKSYMGVPIILNREATGVITVQDLDKEYLYKESDVRLLMTLASNMGVALENARLFEETNRLLDETKQRNAELAIINSVGEAMAKQLDMATVTKIVGDKVKDIFNAEATEILLLDSKTNMINIPYSYYNGYQEAQPIVLGEGLTSQVIQTRKSLIFGTTAEQDKFGAIYDEIDKTESYMGVPIIVGEKVLGVVSVQSYKKNAFDERSVQLLSTLSTNMGVALENARLFEETNRLLDETKQRNAELGVINSVQEGLVAKMDMQAIYDLVGNKIHEIFDAQVVAIGSFDHQNEIDSFNYVLEKGKRFYPDSRPLDNLRKHLIKDRKLILVNALTPDLQKKYAIKAAPGTEDPKSFVFVPLIAGEKVNGYITLQNIDRENAFSESDARLLSTLANSMSVALENARLFDETNHLLDETKQRNAELGVINSVQEGLVAKMDMQAIYDLVGNKIHEIFDAQVVGIGNFDHQNETEIISFALEKNKRFYPEVRPFDNLRKYLIKNRQVILINENTVDIQKKYGLKIVPGTENPKSLLFVPLVAGNKVNGYITLQNIDRENAFSESDVRLLTTLANSMSVALENARLFDETNRLLDETQQRNAELGVINTVQEGLVAKMDMQAIYDLVGNKIHEIFDSQVVMIANFNHEESTELFYFIIEKGKRFYPGSRPFDKLRKHLIETRQVILINENFDKAAEEFGMHLIGGTDAPKSLLFVPLIVASKVRGYISLQNIDRENAFSESDVRLLTTLANSMSVALENARLFNETNRLLDETQQRNAELGVINSVQEGLVAKMDMQAIYDLVGNKIHEMFDAQVVVIRMYDYEKEIVNFNYVIEKEERFHGVQQQFNDFERHLIEHRKPTIINSNFADYISSFQTKAAVEGEVPKSAVYVPMIVGEVVKGNISLQNIDRENAFSESDARLLTTLANGMSVALENARLFNETQQRNTELSILNAIQRGLVMEMNFEGIIELVGDKLREALDFQDIGIRLYEKEKDLVSYPYEYEHGERLYLEPMKPTVVSGYVLKNKKMLLLKKNTAEEIKKLGIKGTDTIPGTDRSKCIVAVPILLGDEARGLIIIEDYEKEDAFSESDIRLLTTLANSMSVALENARLFNETVRLLEESNQRAAELSTVNGISKAIAAHLELDKLINLVGEKIKDLFKANVAYVALYDKENKMINFPYGYGDEFPTLPLGIGIVSQVIKTGEPLLFNKELDEKTTQLGIERSGVRSSSYLGVPIPVGDEIIGVISVQSTEQENRFSEDDMRLLNTIAANVGVAINNAEAYRQLNRTVDQLNSTLKDLKSTQQQLIVSEKLASLGQLTAGIAHEIKNPLNFVNNFAEVSIEMVGELKEEIGKMKDKIEADHVKNVEDILKDLEENAQRINQHGKRADSIVRSMLQHSRGKAGERQDSDINAMLEEDINLAYHGMRARDTSFNIAIEKDFDKNLKRISVVPQDVSRVFLNIINNGFYETGKKKKTLNNNFSPTIKVSTVNLPDKIEVHIRDNGNGIPAEVQDKLFNPFFTTKPTGEGTGLGLSLSHDIIVKQHKGEIRFETEAGEFTEFIITLPKNGNT